jgi:tetratricopeptide (TPR) repeat protein
MQRHERIDQLHQQAAAQYLQGEFNAAMDSWRELLSLDPEDERAREGLRLCEMLAQESGDALSPQDASTGATAPVAPAPAASADAELAQMADSQELAAPQNPGMMAVDANEAPAWDLSSIEEELDTLTAPGMPDPDRQTDGVDLGDPTDVQSLNLDLDGSGVPGPPSVGIGDADDASNAAMELQSRVGELMAEAQHERAEGNIEKALGVLSRVFILDEDNAEARAMQQELQPEEAESVDAPPTEESLGVDEGPDDFADLDLGGDTAALAPEPTPALAPELMPALAPEPSIDDTPLFDEPLDAPLMADPAPEAAPARKTRGGSGGLSGAQAKTLLLAVVVLMAAATGLAGWKFFMDKESVSAETEPAATGARPDANTAVGQQQQTAATPPSTEPASADLPTAATDETPAEILERARLAFREGDYAQAVVAYNQVLAIDPQNPAAKEGLAVAGVKYRDQKDYIEKVERAKSAFDNEDYRSALKIFYRLPEHRDPAKLERWKTNGWYNLGIAALRGGSCSDARSHFGEARAISPADPDITAGIALTRECKVTPKPAGYFDKLGRMPARTLEQ